MQLQNKKHPDLYDPNDLVLNVVFCYNLCTRQDELKGTAKNQGTMWIFVILSFFVRTCALQLMLMLYPRGSVPQPSVVEWYNAKMLYCTWHTENTHFATIVFRLSQGVFQICDRNISLYDDAKFDVLVHPLAHMMPRTFMKSGQFKYLDHDMVSKKQLGERILDVPSTDKKVY